MAFFYIKRVQIYLYSKTRPLQLNNAVYILLLSYILLSKHLFIYLLFYLLIYFLLLPCLKSIRIKIRTSSDTQHYRLIIYLHPRSFLEHHIEENYLKIPQKKPLRFVDQNMSLIFDRLFSSLPELSTLNTLLCY